MFRPLILCASSATTLVLLKNYIRWPGRDCCPSAETRDVNTLSSVDILQYSTVAENGTKQLLREFTTAFQECLQTRSRRPLIDLMVDRSVTFELLFNYLSRGLSLSSSGNTDAHSLQLSSDYDFILRRVNREWRQSWHQYVNRTTNFSVDED